MSETWEFYFTRIEDKPASLLVDLGIHPHVPLADKSQLVWIDLHLQEFQADGFSTQSESERLASLEDQLTAAMLHQADALFVGRITTDGRREYYFYTADSASAQAVAAEALSAWADYHWETHCQADPDWRQYLEFLYPNLQDWQRIKNRRVIEQLKRHGDRLDRPRAVSHWAYFVDADSRQQFVNSIEQYGFSVHNQGQVQETDSPYSHFASFERIDAVDWDSMNRITLELTALATAVAGVYDGWETSVEVD